MNEMGTRPAPAPCNEPVPPALRPRPTASVRSIRLRAEPVSRTKDKGRDPLRRTETKIIPLRHSKGKVAVLATVAGGAQHAASANSPTVKIFMEPPNPSVMRVQCIKRRGSSPGEAGLGKTRRTVESPSSASTLVAQAPCLPRCHSWQRRRAALA